MVNPRLFLHETGLPVYVFYLGQMLYTVCYLAMLISVKLKYTTKQHREKATYEVLLHLNRLTHDRHSELGFVFPDITRQMYSIETGIIPNRVRDM